jgi:DNA repair exonuclease
MKFYCVLGDHDRPKRRGMPPHKLFEIRVLGVNGLEWEDVNGILIAGVSNLRGRMAELLKEEMKKFDALAEKYRKSILVAHQAIDRYLPFEGSYELKEDELPKNATYYAFGHLHARQLVRFGKGFFAYAGSTEILSKDDISSWKKDGKGFYIVDFEGDEPSIQKINLDTRPQIEMEVDQDNLASVFNLDFTKKPILHLKVKGMKINRVNIQKKLDELLKDKVLYHRIDFIDLSKPITELPKGQLRIEELFKKFLKDERLSNLAIELLPLLSKKDIEAAKQVASSYLNEELEK